LVRRLASGKWAAQGVLLVVRLASQGKPYLTAGAEVLQLGSKTHSHLPGQCKVDGGQGGACYANAC